MRSRALILVALAIAPAVSSAQSLPPITRSKQSAQRAVAGTNAHTAAMTDTSAGNAAMSRSNAATASNKVTAPGPRIAGTASSPNEDTTRARVTSKGATAKKPERAVFEREIFAYDRGGRRDPFISLMTTSDIRPLLPDLRLVGIAYDATGRNSVAVLREDAQENRGTASRNSRNTANVPMYRVKEGQQLGRMRVARIGPRSVTFTIEEFGYSRQETLTVSEINTEKKP